MVTCTGHIGIHEGADGRRDVRAYVVRTDVDDVMAIRPNFLTSMGYHIFLTVVLPSARLRRARSSATISEKCFGRFLLISILLLYFWLHQ